MPRPRFVVPVLACLLLAPLTARAGERFRFPEAKHGKGELKYVNGPPVLIVEGTPEEMGEQVGVLALKPAARVVNVLKDFLKMRRLDSAWPLLAAIGNGMVPQFPPDHRKELE